GSPGLLPVLRSISTEPGAVPGNKFTDPSVACGSNEESTIEMFTDGRSPVVPVNLLENLTSAAAGEALAVKWTVAQTLSPKPKVLVSAVTKVSLSLIGFGASTTVKTACHR